MLKKIVLFLLVVVLFFTLTITAYASGPNETGYKIVSVSPKMTYIKDYNYNLSISSNGLANATALVRSYPGVDRVRISMYLQRYDGGWSTIKHWSENYTGTRGSMSKNHYVTSGRYRTVVYFYAYDGTYSERIKKIHQSVWH